MKVNTYKWEMLFAMRIGRIVEWLIFVLILPSTLDCLNCQPLLNFFNMGRGRPKGHSPYADISYEELGDWVGRKSLVKVSRAWLESVMTEPIPSMPLNGEAMTPSSASSVSEPKIEFNLTTFDNE